MCCDFGAVVPVIDMCFVNALPVPKSASLPFEYQLMRNLFLGVLFSVTLAGCVTNPAYKGPTARLSGLGQVEDAVTMRWFTVAEMATEDNLGAACPVLQAGQAVRPECVGGLIAARPMKVKLRATHVSDTPTAELARRAKGRFFAVEGVVDFSPEPGGEYLVNGVLSKSGSSVWIEDVMTKQPVTQVLTAP